eukprot:CCRYP_012542-RD/>CCRYP_012542-RD protein AED:0.47 eAED:0.82 QI:0/0/0/1/0/0/3/0/147
MAPRLGMSILNAGIAAQNQRTVAAIVHLAPALIAQVSSTSIMGISCKLSEQNTTNAVRSFTSWRRTSSEQRPKCNESSYNYSQRRKCPCTLPLSINEHSIGVRTAHFIYDCAVRAADDGISLIIPKSKVEFERCVEYNVMKRNQKKD